MAGKERIKCKWCGSGNIWSKRMFRRTKNGTRLPYLHNGLFITQNGIRKYVRFQCQDCKGINSKRYEDI